MGVTPTSTDSVMIRPARTSDIKAISELIQPLVNDGVLLGKDLVVLYESVQEFVVATDSSGEIIGCGALHVFWEDLGEIRSLVVLPSMRKRGIGHQLLSVLENNARELGLRRLFCLTFEVDFFSEAGFQIHPEVSVDPEVYVELVRSPDEGVAEFLDLARVKPNTLGNSRMVKTLSS